VHDYFQRFGLYPRWLQHPAHRDLSLSVVIPCFNEPNLLASLQSLWNCARPNCAIEVIIVINAAASSSVEVLQQNAQTAEDAARWIEEHAEPRFAFHLIHASALPDKHAGVGLARKIGMDEALLRFQDIGREREGIMVNFDADSECDPNFLTTLEAHFRSGPKCPGCSIYFEHPLSGTLDPGVYEAIVGYELHLRYYVQALRYAGFPHAFHTVGSAMAVRAWAYKEQGGMNKRQAGEDFYFLHKIIPLGGFCDLTETRVIPSPRASNRVPFGTGRAVGDFLEGKQIATYPLQAFLDLQTFFARPITNDLTGFSDALRAFLEREHFDAAVAEFQENSTDAFTLRKRFVRWCNGFRVMKFIHFARDFHYGAGDVEQDPRRLLERKGGSGSDLVDVLTRYRELDRNRSA
jgi:glycosyltransferase involved in cell wall biosynthesis